MKNYKLVPMDRSHLHEIAQIERECFSTPWSERALEEELFNPLASFIRSKLAFLTLEVRESNTPAIQLYMKHGFAQVGRRKDYYQAPKEDALIMTLEFQEEPHA